MVQILGGAIVEEIFRTDSEKIEEIRTRNNKVFGSALIILSFLNMLYLYFSVLISGLLAQNTEINLKLWKAYFNYLGLTGVFLGITYIMVGINYGRFGQIYRIKGAGIGSFLFTFWGLISAYDHAMLLIENPTPTEILEALKSTPEYYMFLYMLIPAVGYILIGRGLFVAKVREHMPLPFKFGAILLIIGGICYPVGLLMDLGVVLASIGSVISGTYLIHLSAK